jgi:hypothetical protein
VRRIILALAAITALTAAAPAGADPSPRACLGQTLKTEVGTADFGQATAQEAVAARPFGTNVVSGLAHCP